MFASSGTHVLMITNHGVHEWQVMPGLTDTGGQNVYVNQLTGALITQGYRVTIVNRGGYPHPVTGAPRTGSVLHPSGRARIVCLEDGLNEFVRKEDMAECIPALVHDLEARLSTDRVDLVMSHYWDGGVLGAELVDRWARDVPHLWAPHSLGALKKQKVEPATWEELRIDERIERERALLPRLSGAVATSAAIRESLATDYAHTARYFLPPCIDVDRYHPRPTSECAGVWEPLAACAQISRDALMERRFVTEVSRTDRTKRKDVLIKAFAHMRDKVPDAALIVSLDPSAGPPYAEAMGLIEDLDLGGDVIVVGSVWELLPCIYAITSVYCTPSVMEGFGMSAQEAAATAVPVVASDRVPFVVEHLLGPNPERVAVGEAALAVGAGGVVAPADDVPAFAAALELLLADADLSRAMGRRAYGLTIPYFTWGPRTRDMLDDLGIGPGGGAG